MNDPVFVKDLTKTYYDESRGPVHAVREIGFTCRPGEIFGLLGANGAGKTTTLRMLTTILKPTAGTARIMGFDVAGEPVEVRRHVGFYSATTALYPRLSARETIEFFARINGYSAARTPARVDELIERFGVEDYARTRIDKLSSGMKQKVAIARTVAHDPPILVFDEPTVGLDVLNALEMQAILTELKAQGKTILFSTHIMSEAEKLCDRIAVIHEGRILASGTLDALRERTGAHYLEDVFVSLIREDA